MIPEHLTIFDKMRDTLPMSVFNSLERKNDPCKSDSPRFYPFRKMRDTLSFLVFYSSERKDDPCKSDRATFYPFWKFAWHFTPVKVRALHFTIVDKMRDTLPFLVPISSERKKKMCDTLRYLLYNSIERKNEPCKSDSPRYYPFWKNACHFILYSVLFIREEERAL